MIHKKWVIFFMHSYYIYDENLFLDFTNLKLIVMKKIAVMLADGFEEIEAISIIDILRRAQLDLLTISIMGKKSVVGAHNIEVIADDLFENVDFTDFNTIILPGGMPGATNLNAHDGLKKLILNFTETKKQLAAICAAPLVFGNLGILQGQKAVCYPGFESYLTGADVLDLPVVESNNIITAHGPGAAAKFALKLVEKLGSEDVANTIAKQMLIS